jgi:hypothetical protein
MAKIPDPSPRPRKSVEIPPCPQAGNGVHAWIMQAVWACRFSEMNQGEAQQAIKARMTRNPTPPNEIDRAIEKVYDARFEDRPQYPAPVRASFKPQKLQKVASKLAGFAEADLIARSPIDPQGVTPADFLRALYRPEESVIIFDQYRSQGQELWSCPGADDAFDAGALEEFVRPTPGNGAWFLANPVSGRWVNLERLKSEWNPEGRSRRAEECLTAFRFLVVESDQADPAQWLAALAQIPLPFVAVYTSGGRSVHALMRIDARDGQHWREIKASIAPSLVTLGADESAMTAVRLTRLPGCFRAEKDALQRLLYLNPAATDAPICELPARSSSL